MEFIDIPTEQTTAVTDAMMGFIAVWAIWFFRKFLAVNPFKARVWQGVFVSLTVAAFLGFWAHGFKMSAGFNNILWMIITLAFGMMVAFFVVAVFLEAHGEEKAKKFLPWMLAVGVIFFIVVLILSKFIKQYFIVFIAYEAIAMVYALAASIKMTLVKKAGMGLMTTGILLTIIAAVLQATRMVKFTLVWEFDHNSAYHFVQMIAVFFFTGAVSRATPLTE